MGIRTNQQCRGSVLVLPRPFEPQVQLKVLNGRGSDMANPETRNLDFGGLDSIQKRKERLNVRTSAAPRALSGVVRARSLSVYCVGSLSVVLSCGSDTRCAWCFSLGFYLTRKGTGQMRELFGRTPAPAPSRGTRCRRSRAPLHKSRSRD